MAKEKDYDYNPVTDKFSEIGEHETNGKANDVLNGLEMKRKAEMESSKRRREANELYRALDVEAAKLDKKMTEQLEREKEAKRDKEYEEYIEKIRAKNAARERYKEMSFFGKLFNKSVEKMPNLTAAEYDELYRKTK